VQKAITSCSLTKTPSKFQVISAERGGDGGSGGGNGGGNGGSGNGSTLEVWTSSYRLASRLLS